MHNTFAIQNEKDKKLPMPLVRSGQETPEVAGEICPLQEGTLIYLSPAIQHAYHLCKAKKLYAMWIRYNDTAADGLCEFFDIHDKMAADLSDKNEAEEVFRHLCTAGIKT